MPLNTNQSQTSTSTEAIGTVTAPTPGSGGSSGSMQSAYAWIVAWLAVIVLLGVLNRTRLGHVVIYYALALCLIFLIVVEYQPITKVLQPLGTSATSQTGVAASGGATS